MPPRREDVVAYLDRSLRLAWVVAQNGHLSNAGNFAQQFISLLPSPMGGDFERWLRQYDDERFDAFMRMAYDEACDQLPVVSFAVLRGAYHHPYDPLYYGATNIHAFVAWYVQAPRSEKFEIWNEMVGLPTWCTTWDWEVRMAEQREQALRGLLDAERQEWREMPLAELAPHSEVDASLVQ